MSLFGKFELQRRLGTGGMGEVFLASFHGGQVAVKRLLPHLTRDKRFIDLFLAEVKLTAQLSHPNIVSIHEFGQEDGSWYLVLDFVDGADLRTVAKLRPALATLVAKQAALALDYAHKARDRQGRSLKVVHRDVSPHNVLVSKAGEVKLIDFGVARAAQGLPGKVAYVAPEVAEGHEATPRSDQFSLGVVLWELLTGKRLFKGASDAMTLQRVVKCDVTSPGGGPVLDEVVLRALSRDPQRRYPDCAAFAQALDDVMLDLEDPATAAELGELVRGI